MADLLRKLPSEMRREGVRHRSSITPDPTPGETEWPHFVDWVRGQKKSALIERWYDEADPIQAPTTKVFCKKCGLSSHKTIDCPKSGSTSLLNNCEEGELGECDETELEEVNVGEALPSREAREEAFKKAGEKRALED